ncbi:hypothetical protein [Muriicola sp. Z0-33]|uniref:hypothetical protein n=1 Tax=Muriicola sp. Z0-33 TaxID=2816957 RepID=UPI002237191C|nr:hypothetical protein [Muriicola sp. Z0-33]MCW5516699.1 hypothetical protein [Muriicola sp. Z0-33]
MKKLLFGICAFLVLVGSACTANTADDQLYENGVDKTELVNGDKKSVDKTKIINGDNKKG